MSEATTVMALEQRRRAAMVAADIPTLEGLMADDLMWIHATARPDTKAGLLATIGSGKTRYLSIDCSEETVRFYGSVAVVSGITDMTAEIAGEHRVLQNRFTILWHQQPAGWKVVNWQSTTVRKP